jgi:acetylornithine deacetylase/succinyl-diaminopimelate desuccinylase-like protein
MSDCDGEDGFRGATLTADLEIAARVGTMFSAEATGNARIEIAYPGISAWKVTAVGRTAHPTEPDQGINAIAKMAKLVAAVEGGLLRLPEVPSSWFKPRVTTNAIRTLPGGGWAIPARCDAVLSILSPPGTSFSDVYESVGAFLRELAVEDGEATFEYKVIPMGAGRLWLRPGEVDPEHPGIRALAEAVQAVDGRSAEVRQFNGGWVDCVELMRPGPSGYGTPAALTFGPGDFELAHAVDEHISISEMAKAAAIYAHAAGRLLGAL